MKRLADRIPRKESHPRRLLERSSPPVYQIAASAIHLNLRDRGVDDARASSQKAGAHAYRSQLPSFNEIRPLLLRDYVKLRQQKRPTIANEDVNGGTGKRAA